MVMLFGCNKNEVRCVTAEGTLFITESPENFMPYDCGDINKVESFALAEFKNVRDPRFDTPLVKKRMNGVTVVVKPVNSWFSFGEEVSGLTACLESKIYINTDIDLQFSSYTHEMAHWIQNCEPRRPLEGETLYEHQHSNWKDEGIYDVVDKVLYTSKYYQP